MTSFDYLVLAIIGLSIVLSLMRGFVREVLAIIGWLAAFFVAKTYSQALLPMMPVGILTESLRMLAAFLVLFLATLLLVGLLSMLISKLIKVAGLSVIDRLLGAFFGLARGCFLVCLMVFLAGFTSFPHDQFWRDARLSGPLEVAVTAMLPWLPADMAKQVHYP